MSIKIFKYMIINLFKGIFLKKIIPIIFIINDVTKFIVNPYIELFYNINYNYIHMLSKMN